VAASASIALSNSAPLASAVTISDNNGGQPLVGDTLTASYSYSDVDGDAEGVSQFQWFRGTSAITGATSLSYTLVTADANQTLRFQVIPVAVSGTSPGVAASATITVINSVPVATNVLITDNNGGQALVGDTLTASYSYSDVDSDVEGASQYQWYRGTTAITGATSLSYTMVTADANQTLMFQVIPVALTGTSPGVAASATITVINSVPVATNVLVSDVNGGQVVIGDVLNASYSFSDVDGDAEGASQYQWFRGTTAITGATALTYTTVTADANQTLVFQVIPVAATGASPGVAASASIALSNSAPLASAVTISDINGGQPLVGDTLTASYVYSDVDGDAEGVSQFQWFRGTTAIAGATSLNYTITLSDANQTLIFQVIPVAVTGTSPGIAATSSINVVNSVPLASNVLITDINGGQAVVGDVLSGSYTYSDVDGDAEGASQLQWFRGTTPINGATTANYTVTSADTNQTLYFEVIPIAVAGNNPGLAVNASINIFNSAPVANNVSISDANGGSIDVNDVLTGTYTYNDADGDAEGVSTYQWYLNGVAIVGATNISYTVIASDAGQPISFEVTPVASTGASPGIAAASAATIVNSPPKALSVSVTDNNGGSANVNDVLSGSYIYTDVDNDLEGASTYQWYRSGVAIIGANAMSYTVTSADAGQVLSFEVIPVAISGTNPGLAVVSATMLVNSAPVANNVSIVDNNGGTADVNDVFSGSYTYFDVNNDPEGISTYQWYRNGIAITGATGLSYTAVSADAGQSLTFEVTPIASAGTSPGVPVLSAALMISNVATGIAQNFLGISNSQLVNVNGLTGQITANSRVGMQGLVDVRQIDYDYVDKLVYAINVPPPNTSSSTEHAQIASIDLVTGVKKIVAYPGAQYAASVGIAVDSSKKLLYSLNTNGDLYSYDLVAKTSTLIANIGVINGVTGLALDALGSGNLYTVNATTSQLISITPAGVASIVATLTTDISTPKLLLGSPYSLTFDHNSGKILALYYAYLAGVTNYNEVVSIDPTSAIATSVGGLIFGSSGNTVRRSIAFQYDALVPANNSLLALLSGNYYHTVSLSRINLPAYGGMNVQTIPFPFKDLKAVAYDSVANVVYGIDTKNHYVMSYSAGTVSNIGQVNIVDDITALAFNPATPNYLYASAANTLYRIDKTTWKATLIGSMGTSINIIDMAVDPSANAGAGQLYALESYRNQINMVDTTTGAMSNPITISQAGMQNIGFAALTATYQLVGVSTNRHIYSIDSVSGTATDIAPTLVLTNNYSNITFNADQLITVLGGKLRQLNLAGLAPTAYTETLLAEISLLTVSGFTYDSNNNVFYVISNTFEAPFYVLYSINPDTGAITRIGQVGSSTFEDIAFDPSTGYLYGKTYSSSPTKGFYAIRTSGAEPLGVSIGSLNYSDSTYVFGNYLSGIAFDNAGTLYAMYGTSTSESTLVQFTVSKDVSNIPIGVSNPGIFISRVPFSSGGYIAHDSASDTLLANRSSISSTPNFSRISTTGVSSRMAEIAAGKIVYSALNNTYYALGTIAGINAKHTNLTKTTLMSLGIIRQSAVAYDDNSGKILVIDADTGNLLQVDPLTADTSIVGYSELGDITAMLYLSQNPVGEKLLAYDRALYGFVTLDSATAKPSIKSFTRATIADLAIDSSPTGANTVYASSGLGITPVDLTTYTLSGAITNFVNAAGAPFSSIGINGLTIDNQGVGYATYVPNNSSYLLQINLATGVVTDSQKNIGFYTQYRGLTIDKVSGRIYTQDSSRNDMLTIDRTSGAGTTRGSLPYTFNMLTYNPSNLTYYGSNGTALYALDPVTGYVQYVPGSDTGVIYYGGLAVNPASATFYASNSSGTNNDNLYTFSTTSNLGLLPYNIAGQQISVSGLTWNSNSNSLFGLTKNQKTLFNIADLTTATGSLIGTAIGTGTYVGLVHSPLNNAFVTIENENTLLIISDTDGSVISRQPLSGDFTNLYSIAIAP